MGLMFLDDTILEFNGKTHIIKLCVTYEDDDSQQFYSDVKEMYDSESDRQDLIRKYENHEVQYGIITVTATIESINIWEDISLGGCLISNHDDIEYIIKENDMVSEALENLTIKLEEIKRILG